MQQRVPRENYPWWVRYTVGGAQTRTRAWFYFLLSALFGGLGIAFLLAGIGFVAPIIAAVGGPISATLYLFAIKWMDRYGEWPR